MVNLFDGLASLYDEVGYADFYRELFPEGSFEEKGVFEDGKYNGIALSIGKGSRRAKRFTVTDDLDVIDDLAASDDFCLMSPISYVGKARKSENARFMYALAIDLDGIETLNNWQFFIQQIEEGHKMLKVVWGLPRPTYVVASGTGVHLYYFFEQPVPLFKNIVSQLAVLKKRLTWQAWTQGSSVLHDNVQYESLFQGFRIVGTITKNGDRCRAFRVGGKVSVEYLNQFVPEEYRVESFTYKSDLRLAEAKKLYPEWYQRRVVEKCPRGTWVCKRDLYDWWIRTFSGQVEQGHRYWCIMTMAVYAKKCNIPFEELEEDAYGLIPLMNTKGDLFTEDDVLHALAAYTDSYITYPIDTIVVRTGIPIEKNKRNWRKQDVHVKIMTSTRDILYPNGEWRKGNGRPKGSDKKMDVIARYMEQHPDCSNISQIARECAVSRPSVYKYLYPEKYGERYEKIKNKAISEKLQRTKKISVGEASWDELTIASRNIMAICQEIAAKRGISEEEAYEIYKRNPQNLQITKKVVPQKQPQQVDSQWHTVLPEYYVVEGDPNMMSQMMEYASAGIRSVEILSKDEYNYLKKREETSKAVPDEVCDGFADWLIENSKRGIEDE